MGKRTSNINAAHVSFVGMCWKRHGSRKRRESYIREGRKAAKPQKGTERKKNGRGGVEDLGRAGLQCLNS